MHEHIQCEHELKYCLKCDTVYCEKCMNEWIKKAVFNVVSSPYISYGTELLGDGTVIQPYTFSNHVHGKDLE